MTTLEFQDIMFEYDPKDPEKIKMVFLRVFESDISKAELEKIGPFTIEDGVLDFPDSAEKQVSNKFNIILSKAFSALKNRVSGNPSVYIHQNSDIPLIGNLYFGIVDRGTNIIELKPITSCNIDCSFCSVSEGCSHNKNVDYVVEAEYLTDELKKLIDFKLHSIEPGKKLDVFINPRGEPLLYASIVDLVRQIRTIPIVGRIAIITNGTMLSRQLIDSLVGAGLDQIDISINAIDADKAKDLAGSDSYNIDNVLGMTEYIAKTGKVKVIIAPVWLNGINDKEIHKIIEFAKSINAEVGIQNYLAHARGKKLVNQVPWDKFGEQLKEWEKLTGTKLLFEDHSSFKTPQLEKPFRKGDTIKADIVCPGKMRGECMAVANNRTISVVDCEKTSGNIKVKILKDKNNTFVGRSV